MVKDKTITVEGRRNCSINSTVRDIKDDFDIWSERSDDDFKDRKKIRAKIIASITPPSVASVRKYEDELETLRFQSEVELIAAVLPKLYTDEKLPGPTPNKKLKKFLYASIIIAQPNAKGRSMGFWSVNKW